MRFSEKSWNTKVTKFLTRIKEQGLKKGFTFIMIDDYIFPLDMINPEKQEIKDKNCHTEWNYDQFDRPDTETFNDLKKEFQYYMKEVKS